MAGSQLERRHRQLTAPRDVEVRADHSAAEKTRILSDALARIPADDEGERGWTTAARNLVKTLSVYP